MSKRRAKTDVDVFNHPWSATKVRLLLDGECLINEGEDLISGRSAYEQRQRAYDGYGSPDSILDAIQMDMAIDTIRDNEVRIAMKLRTLGAWDEYAIEEALNSRRAGHHLLNRGCDLVRRNERNNAGKVRRVKVEKMANALIELDDPVEAKRERGRPSGSNVPVSKRGLEWLIKTQETADEHIPGGYSYDNNEVSRGDMDTPTYEEGWNNLGEGGRKRTKHEGQ